MHLDKDKIIVIEPVIKSTESRDLIKESATILLESNDLKLQSVRTEGYFVILRLSDTSQSVNAINILKKLSGVTFIFVGNSVELDYNTIVDTVISTYSNVLLNGETYYLLVRSTALTCEDGESTVKKFDMEFHIHSELSAKSGRFKRSENDREADVIIYILLGNNRCYISKLAFKGKDLIPLDFLKDNVLCPIFDSISLISFLSVLKSGYNPVPFFFYLEKRSMKKMLKVFETLISDSSITSIDIYILSLEEYISKLVQHSDGGDDNREKIIEKSKRYLRLIFLKTIIKNLDETILHFSKVSLPLTPYAHPPWFIKELITIFERSKKITLTPLLFNYSNHEFEIQISRLAKLGMVPELGVDNLKQIEDELYNEDLEILIKEIAIDHLHPLSSKYLKKYTLRVGEDYLFDIFDSI